MYDMGLAMSYLGCGFVAKEAVTKIPFFGTMNIGLHTIFVDRGSAGAKKDVLEEIGERQKDYYEGKSVMPFLIFPEGTTTSGRHILTFKKGAFNSLLPIKPTFIHPNMGKKFHIGCGASHAGFSYLRALCQLYNKVEYVELPIMTPNEYMFTNFSSYGKEKWEIYAEVSREIMCTLGNFKKSNMGIKDSFRYISCIKEKALLDRSTYKIKDE
jgi:lysophosphatidylcholine acyltransferase/lyso-PAF acetyltransferase